MNYFAKELAAIDWIFSFKNSSELQDPDPVQQHCFEKKRGLDSVNNGLL